MSQDVLRGEFDVPDLILMVLSPPLFGCAIGLLLSLARRRPGLAAIGGIAGGTVGAWAGVAVYRWVDIADLAIFQTYVLGGVLLGAIPLGWLMAGPKATDAGGGSSIGKPIHKVGCGVAIAGAFLTGSTSTRLLWNGGRSNDLFYNPRCLHLLQYVFERRRLCVLSC